jgi:uncharacterized membrane protein YeiH
MNVTGRNDWRTPVGWMLNLEYVYVIALSFFYLYYLEKIWSFAHIVIAVWYLGCGFLLNWSRKRDKIGLHPLFYCLRHNDSLFGGVFEISCAMEIPVIFRKEIYATLYLMDCFFLLRKMNLEDDIVYPYNLLGHYFISFIGKWSLNGFAHFSKRVKNDYFSRSLKI